jgi:hypothetical protein
LNFKFLFFDFGDLLEYDFTLEFGFFAVMINFEFIEHIFDSFIIFGVGIEFIAFDDKGHGIFDFLSDPFVLLDLLLFDSFL